PRPGQHLLAAGIVLETDPATMRDVLGPLVVSFDYDERHALSLQLVGNDAADTAMAAENEVVLNLFQHSTHAAPLEPSLQAALDDDCGHCGRGIKDRPHTADEQNDCEYLTGPAERMHFAKANSRDRRDRHIEGVPRIPSLDHHVPECAGRNDDQEEQERQPWTTRPQSAGARRWHDKRRRRSVRHGQAATTLPRRSLPLPELAVFVAISAHDQ